MGIEGLGEKDTDRILELIEALTVVEGDADDGGGEGTQSEDSGELEENPNALIDDCLLYTSPSPRDLSTSRMPSSA